MTIQDLWTALDALPWPAPWVAHTFEIDCPCPNGVHCGDAHSCEEVNAPEAYPYSPEEPADPGEGQCVVQISVPGLETLSKPCAAFIVAARNELPAVRERIAKLEADREALRGALAAYLNGHTAAEHLAELDGPNNGSPFALGVRAMYRSGVRVEAPSKTGAGT